MFGKSLHQIPLRRVVVAVAALAAVCGCGHDTRLSGKNIPSVKVRTVTLYDIVLDSSATPEQVAYAALRAVREDFFAKTIAEREAALLKQFDLCAADELAERNRLSLPRDEFIYNVVYRWTPTVSHYAGDLPEDWASASGRLVRRAPKASPSPAGDPEEAEVALEVNRPGEDPRAKVVLVVWLAKDNGYWRVMHLGFDRKSRSVAAREPVAGRGAGATASSTSGDAKGE